MYSAWIIFVFLIFIGVDCGVVVRRRPISFQERFAIASTTNEPETTSIAFKAIETSTSGHRLSRLTLPSNATSIRSDITDSFSCTERTYGYYADVENDCQIFHVCLPVTYPDGKEQQFRWSFICPEETTFNQEAFTCVRTDEMPFDCSESEKFYELNRILGLKDDSGVDDGDNNQLNEFSSNNNENIRISPEEKIKPTAIIENMKKDKVVPVVKTPSRNTVQNNLHRVPIFRRTTTENQYSVYEASTEKFVAATNYDGSNKISTISSIDRIGTTVYPPTDVAEFNTEQPNETTQESIAESTSTIQSSFDTDLTTIGVPQEILGITNTRIVPDLYEVVKSTEAPVEQQKAADEVVESIKFLQNIFPAQNLPLNGKLAVVPSTIDDLRNKRFLFKADSIKNRQKLFEKLNDKQKV